VGHTYEQSTTTSCYADLIFYSVVSTYLSGYSSAWSECVLWEHEVEGSNPFAPTILKANVNQVKRRREAMSIFGTKRDYNTIVAPLKRIEGELSTHIGDERNEVNKLETDKEDIDAKIAHSHLEIKKSEHTVTKIAELLGEDFNGDGEPDFVEPVAVEPIVLIDPVDDKDDKDKQ
jgi:hypothetical protein